LPVHARDLHPELDPETLFAKIFAASLGDLLVGRAEERGQGLEDRDLRAEPAPHAAHLQTDYAGAAMPSRFGHVGNRERSVVAEDQLLVEGRPAARAAPSRSRRSRSSPRASRRQP